MKTQIYYLLIILDVFCFAVPSHAQDSSNAPIGFVKKVIRSVEDRQTVDDDWESSKPGTRIYNGHNVKTDIRSIAIVTFLDGSVLRVRPESEINIYGGKNKSKNSINTKTDIEQGVIGFNVKKQNPDDEFVFTTPTGVASIRGTHGSIGVGSDGSTTLIVGSGLVNLKANSGLEEQGNVGGGFTGKIAPDGSVDIHKSTDDEKKNMENQQNDKTKTYIIETNDGKFKVEILVDDDAPIK